MANKYTVAVDLDRIADAIEDVPTTMPPQGQQTVSPPGTRKQLVVASTPLPRGGCYIIPFPTNTGLIFVGGSDVTSSNGVAVGAGQILPWGIDDANKIWIDADADSQKVSFVGFER